MADRKERFVDPETAARNEAYQEGYSKGYSDGYSDGRLEGDAPKPKRPAAPQWEITP